MEMDDDPSIAKNCSQNPLFDLPFDRLRPADAWGYTLARE
jgi:hypothetical protein